MYYFSVGYIRTIEMQYSVLSQETLSGQWDKNGNKGYFYVGHLIIPDS